MAEGAARGRAIAPIALLGLLLAGCASHNGGGPPVAGEGTYRVGRPYEVHGVWYHPAVDYNYDHTGVASWYGEEFEGRLTANGEIFDLNRLTAAHTTLPMPSIIQVTNLENGRSLQLRVNDRGPFADGRLIDVSRRAAQLLGFEHRGTTLVRVKVLKSESIAAAEEAMHGSGEVLVAAAPEAVAAAPPPPPARRAAPPIAPAYAPRAVAAPPPPQVAEAPAEPPPRIAMAPAPPPPPLPPPAAHAAPSRFALISPAEAAELPPARPSPAAPSGAPSHRVVQMPSSAPKFAAGREASGRLFVQAGAFSVRDNARRVQTRIQHLGSVEVTAASVHGVEMYRVRLGPLGSVAQADNLLARVVGSGYPAARIVGD